MAFSMAINDLGLLASANSKTAGTTLTLTNSSGSTIPAGSLLVLIFGCDNIASTTQPTITFTTNNTGGTWAALNTPRSSGVTTTAGAGVWGFAYYVYTSSDIANGTTISVITSNQSNVARAAIVEGFTNVSGAPVGTNGGTSTSGAPSAALTSATNGNLVVGLNVFEANASASDTDTTNGTWDTLLSTGTSGGNSATNVSVGTQDKVVTATGGQTYNPTNANDSIAFIAEFAVAPTTAKTGAETPAISVSDSSSLTIIPGVSTFTDTFSTTPNNTNWMNTDFNNDPITFDGSTMAFNPINAIVATTVNNYVFDSYYFELVQLPVGSAEFSFTFKIPGGASAGENIMRYNPTNNLFYPGSSATTPSLTPSSSTRFFKFTRTGTSTVQIDYSPDATSWTTWTTVTASGSPDLSFGSPAFYDFTTRTTPAKIDNFNNTPAPPVTTSGAENPTISLSESSSIVKFNTIGTPWVGTATPGNAANVSANGATIDISGATVGEVVWVFGALSDAQTGPVSTPSGWTSYSQFSEGTSGSSSSRAFIMWRVKQSGDTNVTITWGVTCAYDIVAISWPNVDTTTPGTAPSWVAHTTGSSYVTGSQTPPGGGSWAVAAFFARGTTATTSWSTDFNLVERSATNTTVNPFTGVDVADSGTPWVGNATTFTSTGQTSGHGSATEFYLYPSTSTGSTPITGSETPAISVTETSSVSGTLSRTEAPAVSVAETSSINGTMTTTDSCAVSVSETSSVSITQSTTDTAAVSASETSTVALTLSTTDTSAVSVADSSSIQPFISATESPAVSVAETRSVAVTQSTTDSAAISVAETSAVAVIQFISATDAAAVSVAETSSISGTIATTDTAAVSVSETSAVSISFSTTDAAAISVAETSGALGTFTATDATAISVAESVATRNAFTAIETPVVSITETSAVAVTQTASDAAAVGVAEVSSLFLIFTSTDTSAVSTAETSSVSGTVTTTDTSAMSVAETSGIANPVSATDSAAVSVSETSASSGTMAATDASAVSVSDISNVGSSSPGADSAAVSVSETSIVAVTHPTTDSGAISINESSSITISDTRSATESPAVSVAETSAIAISDSHTDASAISVAETSALASSSTSTDVTNVSVAETTSTVSSISTNDTPAVSVDDQSTIFVSVDTTDMADLAVDDSANLFLDQSAVDAASISVDDSSLVNVREPGRLQVYVGGQWVAGIMYIYKNGVWKEITPKVFLSGTWN